MPMINVWNGETVKPRYRRDDPDCISVFVWRQADRTGKEMVIICIMQIILHNTYDKNLIAYYFQKTAV